MRACNQSSCSALKNEDVTYGIFLAADYCGQHEDGIDDLGRRMGIKMAPGPFDHFKAAGPVPVSVDYTGTVTDTFYVTGKKPYKVKGKYSLLVIGYDDREHPIKETGRYAEETIIAGAFDRRSLAIRGYGEEGMKLIALLREGFETGDIAMWFGNDPNPFGRGGLILVRPSLTPQALKDRLDNEYTELMRLNEAVSATGIVERIQNGIKPRFNRIYHALSPGWKLKSRTNGVPIVTEHPVMFFLNPADQKAYNHGWFTVEELDQWIQGTGPVIKAPAEKAA